MDKNTGDSLNSIISDLFKQPYISELKQNNDLQSNVDATLNSCLANTEANSVFDAIKLSKLYRASLPDDFDPDAKLIVNLSKFTLNENHISVLQKGLTFCPTSLEADMADLKRDLDKFHRSLRLKAYFNKDKQKITSDTVSTDTSTPASKPKRGRPRRTRSLLDVQCTSQPNNIGQTQSDIEAILDTSSVFDPGLLSKGFKHQDFKLPNHTWEPPQNPPEALVAMQMVNDIDLANVKIELVRPRNLTKQELQAMRELANNKNIVIKPADKGSAIVIQDLEDYIARGEATTRS